MIAADELLEHPRFIRIERSDVGPERRAISPRHRTFRLHYLLPDGRITHTEGRMSVVLESFSDAMDRDREWQEQLAAAAARMGSRP